MESEKVAGFSVVRIFLFFFLTFALPSAFSALPSDFIH